LAERKKEEVRELQLDAQLASDRDQVATYVFLSELVDRPEEDKENQPLGLCLGLLGLDGILLLRRQNKQSE
jgi:hypothetical protein